VCGIIAQAIDEGCGQEIEKNWRDGLGEKDAALVKATLFGASLGGSGKLVALGIEDIRWNRFKETSGVVLFGLSCGELARDAAFLEGMSD
jgi:hypothetical protein